MNSKSADDLSAEKGDIIHPWVKTTDFATFHGKPVSFVGKVKGADSKALILTDFKGMYLL